MISLARITWRMAKKWIFRLKLNNSHLMSWYRSNTRTWSGFLCLPCKHDGTPATSSSHQSNCFPPVFRERSYFSMPWVNCYCFSVFPSIFLDCWCWTGLFIYSRTKFHEDLHVAEYRYYLLWEHAVDFFC